MPKSAATLRSLIDWFEANKRDMPWRKTRDPYKIWISEILLQQTQVATVEPYYNHFVKTFPTVQTLAKAPLDRVLKAWEGCGYYARARNLHKAAKQIVAMGGKLPRTAKELRDLSGIGPYTSAAIASIAFGEAVPVLDGNVERVIARVTGEEGIISEREVHSRLRSHAEQWMQIAVNAELSPGDLNESLMELGATVCKPREALCAQCPLKRVCVAKKTLQDVTVLPRKPLKPRTPHYDIGAAIVRKNGRILITKRPEHGMLGGLWEFPGGKQESGESLKECVQREMREELAMEVEVGEQIASVKHAYTHFKITLHCFECKHVGGELQLIHAADAKWVKPAELANYAFPKADRVVLQMLMKS
ncbi:MAG: A/G-specific adenine glycosylase [Calditrichaeota bacterium]|nr:A/G-specific adenine glycosylase [Calditrichota bacterium]MCB9369065.1 A/G-specific adenine glycosylase [Calditrichota bacterium]